MLVQVSIIMAAKPNHRGAALLWSAWGEMQAALRANETPKMKITQYSEAQKPMDRLAARGSVEVERRLSRLQWKVKYQFHRIASIVCSRFTAYLCQIYLMRTQLDVVIIHNSLKTYVSGIRTYLSLVTSKLQLTLTIGSVSGSNEPLKRPI